MKNTILFSVFIFCASCTSLKYSAVENPDDYKNVKAGNKYIFHQNNGSKTKITITSIARDSIIGTSRKDRISIAKNDIQEIRKDNSGLAIIIAAGGIAGAAVIISATVKASEDLVDTFAAVGSGTN
ncbi:hypothetical protein [Chryseobacterium sp. Leaf394]|uniref:hypothetical protein n=1 Tax=Chryseobacterium sp. Leaf394 TaxID=1736361 RepID=UPI0006F9E77E|nr:hypothetical protein [Chryseobacterium sp. Leaf394]KQS95251.1 hypothetical protein ASG21_17590 [Chryseobacterium sp. Leaf394]